MGITLRCSVAATLGDAGRQAIPQRCVLSEALMNIADFASRAFPSDLDTLASDFQDFPVELDPTALVPVGLGLVVSTMVELTLVGLDLAGSGLMASAQVGLGQVSLAFPGLGQGLVRPP